MPASATTSFTSDAAISTYYDGLQSAHALERQAIQLSESQFERLENYPEVEQLLRTHLRETERQIGRLDEILHSFAESRSLLKDMATQTSGTLQAYAYALMPDEVLKNHFANRAFENFEIATYTSLITMAEATGHQRHVVALKTTLREEENMAQALRDMTPDLTLKYLRLSEKVHKTDR
jgi:ferritin-like metal-binding protein YciE